MVKRLMTRTFLIGSVLAVLLSVGVLIGCTGNNEGTEGPESGRATAGQEVSERGGGEHGGAGEGSEGGGEGAGGEGGSEEGSGANQLAPDETFDMVRSGARLIMSYDAASNSFKGTVENTTNNVLTRVRIEVHLSDGTELGPTTPIDLAPGRDGGSQPALDAGIVHRVDSPCRGWQRRGGGEGWCSEWRWREWPGWS